MPGQAYKRQHRAIAAQRSTAPSVVMKHVAKGPLICSAALIRTVGCWPTAYRIVFEPVTVANMSVSYRPFRWSTS